MDKKVLQLVSERKIKYSQVRIVKRKDRQIDNYISANKSIEFGSIRGVQDEDVPFDGLRKDEHIKCALRPCLVVEEPEIISTHSAVLLAPGTTTFHKNESTLEVKPASDGLKEKTYFLIYFKWFASQIELRNRFGVLNHKQIEQLKGML